MDEEPAITYLNDKNITTYSYGDLLEKIEVWTKNIDIYGIRQGDRVAIISPSVPNVTEKMPYLCGFWCFANA